MHAVTVWLDDELHRTLRILIARTGNSVSEEEAIRAVFREAAAHCGYLRFDSNGTRSEHGGDRHTKSSGRAGRRRQSNASISPVSVPEKE
jgi:hypothetical protein